MGMVIGIKSDKIGDYKRLHAAVWPDILAQIRGSNIRNYTIFLREPENLLFSYWEYHGDDFVDDMAKMACDKTTQKWWELTDPCQQPLVSVNQGEQWAIMDEVFHED